QLHDPGGCVQGQGQRGLGGRAAQEQGVRRLRRLAGRRRPLQRARRQLPGAAGSRAYRCASSGRGEVQAVHREAVSLAGPATLLRLPAWARKGNPLAPAARPLRVLLREERLVTVCEEARCPNLSECFARGTATFMLLGDQCTRRCGYCAVATGRPRPADPGEPARVADAAARLRLRYVVLTAVARDDLSDGGASQFAATVEAVRARLPEAQVEVLTPDFKGERAALRIVLGSRPDVFNHNVEMAPRLFPSLRPQGDYARSLELLRYARTVRPAQVTKSGLMLGLGETDAEVREVLA